MGINLRNIPDAVKASVVGTTLFFGIVVLCYPLGTQLSASSQEAKSLAPERSTPSRQVKLPDGSVFELLGPEDEKSLASQVTPKSLLRGQQLLKQREDRRLAFLSKNPDFKSQAVLPQLKMMSTLPAQFSWRQQGFVTSVKQQKGGTCWAFAYVGQLEALWLIRHRESLDLSEQAYIRCYCRACNGKFPRWGGEDTIIDFGIPAETADPVLGDGAIKPCNNTTVQTNCQNCNTTIRYPHRDAILQLVDPTYNTKLPDEVLTTKIKRALMEHGPIVVNLCLPAWSTLGSLKASKVYRESPNDCPTEHGSHIVLITGWDDVKGAWEVKNSWGTGWADQGFGWIAYGSNRIGMGAWFAEPWMPSFRVTAVWRKGAEERKQVYGREYGDYRKLYDTLWPQGWRLVQLDNAVRDGNVQYSAVWRKSAEPELQLYSSTYKSFKAKYDELWPKGWRIEMLNNYEVNGSVLYTAVWRKGTAAEIQWFETSYTDFKKKYDELWPKGWRLHILNTFTVAGQPRYNAVWRKGDFGEIQWLGVGYSDYRKKYDEIWPKGWRLYTLSNYVIGGKVYYSAVFRQKPEQEVQVYSWEYDDFRAKDDELSKAGWKLHLVNTYEVGG